jgi:superfamily II DNA helicase RecQ
MLASLLQYLEPFLERYGADHVVMVALFDQAARFKISKEKLVSWGRIVRNDFNRKNIRNSATTIPSFAELLKGVKETEKKRGSNSTVL